jgi:hypothetical protein
VASTLRNKVVPSSKEGLANGTLFVLDGAETDADPRLYLRAIVSRWRPIVGCTVLAGVATLLITKFAITPLFRAEAILRPVAEQAEMGRLQGPLGFAGSYGSSLFLGGFGMADERAEEYMAILRSYEFTTSLINHYKLAAQLGGGLSPSATSQDPTWRRYRMLRGQFQCQYDRVSGNMTLYFTDSSRAEAQQMLTYYVDSLRDRVRREEVQGAKTAAASLEDEARSTGDSLLRAQLYELISRQIQREKLAQAEADFAFKLIEPPVVPDRPFSPRPKLDSVLAGALVFMLVSIGALVLGPRADVTGGRPYPPGPQDKDAGPAGQRGE